MGTIRPSNTIRDAIGIPLRTAGAPANGTDEIQTITLSAFAACTVRFGFAGAFADVTFTGSESNSAIDTAVTAALEGLATIGTGNVSVAVSGTTNRAIAVTFTGALAKLDVSLLSATVSGGSAVRATLSTNLSGATNNDLTYTAVTGGTAGNSITIAYIDPSANDAELSVDVAASAITVNLATGVAGAITSIASEVAAAITASVPASALVTVANKAGNDGTGVVAALSATPLAGGTAAPSAAVTVSTPGVSADFRGAPKGSLLTDTANALAYQNSGTDAVPAWSKVGTQS